MNPWILAAAAVGIYFVSKAMAQPEAAKPVRVNVSLKLGDTFKTKPLKGHWEASYPVGQGPNKVSLKSKKETDDGTVYTFEAIKKTEKNEPFKVVMRGPDDRVLVFKVTIT